MKTFIKKFFAQTNFWLLLSVAAVLTLLLPGDVKNFSLETPLQAAETAEADDSDEDEDLDLDLDALDSDLDDDFEEDSDDDSEKKAPEATQKPADEADQEPEIELEMDDDEDPEIDLELDDEPEAAAEPAPEEETPAAPKAQSILKETPDADAPENSAEEVKSGFSKLFKKGSSEKAEKAEKPGKKAKIDVPPLETVLPANSALILRVSSLRDFNERLEKLTETNFLMLFKTLGKGDYAKQVAPDSQIGAILFPEGGTFQWAAFVPAKNYKKLLALLNVDTGSYPDDVPEGTVSVVSETLCVAPFSGYALFGPDPAILRKVMAAPKFIGTGVFTPCAIKEPTLSIELTNVLIRFLVQRGRIGMEEFAPIFTPEMLGIQEGSEQMALARQYFDHINDSISWLGANVQSARLDLAIMETSSVLSTSFLPKPGTPLAEKIQDPYVPLISTRLDNRSFLKVAPTWPAPLFGQVDMPPLTAEKLDAPFNRIRHVEFSLMTPPQNGRLAEGWCFFLEVNDSNAFIKELLVPRAEEVGGQFGANTLAEIGRDVAQQTAERRLNRQLNRRRPPLLPYANPDEAAQRGESIGGLVGGLIGKAVAKKEALKVQDYMGYDLYVSDLIQYSQLKKRIQQQNQGTAPPVLSGGLSGGLIGLLIEQVVTGEANVNLQDKIMGDLKKEDPRDPPLVATRNLIVTLDPNHLLIVPGNDFVLYEALRRWKQTQTAYQLPIPERTPEELQERERMPKYDPGFKGVPPRSPDEPRTAWLESWVAICDAIAEPNMQQVRFASIFSPKETLRTAEMASQMYGVEIPERIRDGIPADLPPFLMVYTTSYQTGSTFTAIPHEMSKAQFQKLITALPALLAK